MSAHSVYNIDPNLRKVIQQHLTTYRKSGRNKEDLTLLATRFESLYQDQNAIDNQQTLVTKAIDYEIRALQSQFQSQSDEDNLLSGLLISWQVRYELLDNQASQHKDIQTDASKVKSIPNNSSAKPNLQPLYTPVITPSITTSSITAPSPKPLASTNNTSPTPELITSLSSYAPASWWMVITISLLVWIVVKLPEWTFIPYVSNIEDGLYYSLLAPVYVILGLTSYFIFIHDGRDIQQNKQSADIKKKQLYWLGMIVLYGLFLFTAVWRSDSKYEFYADGTVFMMMLHSPILLVGLLGAVMYSHSLKSWRARLAYLHYLGEVGVFSILILFGGVLLTAFTLALFSLSGNYGIEEWYITFIVPLGIVATPIVASHLYLTVFYERSRVASILLQVFSPLCAITFLVYLGSLIASGTLPTEDREALIGINALLIIIWVMSVYHIIVRRSKANRDRVLPSTGVPIGNDTVGDSLIKNTGECHVNNENSFGFMDSVTAFMLAVVSVFNVVILYSMIHRFVNYGFTLNRFIVTGVNIVIFIHLCLIGYQYFQLWRHPERGDRELKKSITRYLPVYAIWSLFVVVIVMVNAWF